MIRDGEFIDAGFILFESIAPFSVIGIEAS
jgi:hypothetical protein